MADKKIKVVKRFEKVAFCEIGTEDSKFYRMKGFTNLAKKYDAKEYSRQYVDEEFETTDVLGIDTTMDFEFDEILGNKVSEHISEIIENEKIGADAIINIVVVDFTKPIESKQGEYKAVKRPFVVSPSGAGDGVQAYKYTGTFKVAGGKVVGSAKTDDKWETITFTEKTEDVE